MRVLTFLTSLFIVLFSSQINLNGQTYQIPNSGFENWNANNVPVSWNTFSTGNCHLGSIICGSAMTDHHSQESARPGSSGTKSLRIYSLNIMGVVANGTMTTGRINLGNASASSTSNYNYTDASNASYRVPFYASPDSIYFWAKYTATSSSSQARMTSAIHGNTNFEDPNHINTASLYRAKATLDFYPTNNSWVQKKVPFTYDGSSGTSFIILTFTTNNTAGGGHAGDALYIDDIELIYSAWLTDLKLNGTTIDSFRMDKFDYYVEYPRGTSPSTPIPTITYTRQVSDATVNITTNVQTPGSIDGAQSVITVTAEDGTTIKTYTIHYSIYKSSNNTLLSFVYRTALLLDTVMVSGTNAPIVLPPGSTEVPTIISCSLADTGARATITQPFVVFNNLIADGSILVRAENGSTKTYSVPVSVQLSDNANLTSISYNGTPIANFHPDTLNYHIEMPSGTVLVPFVNATAQWGGIVPTITQASSMPGTATINVIAEDGITQKTYTVSFTVGISRDASLSSIRYNGLTLSNFHADTLQYQVELPFGTSQVNVLAQAVSSSSQITINQISSLPGTVTITVTAEDTNYKKTYSINFILGRNNNANLDSLQYGLSGNKILVPNFNAAINFYDVTLPVGTIEVPVVFASVQDSNASISITQAVSANDTATIVVVAENRSTTKTYKIAFKVALSVNNNLSSIAINGVNIVNFASNVLSYNITLDTLVMPTITAITAYPEASYSVVYPATLPGQAQIIVLAEDSTVKKTYRINISQTASNNSNLMELSYTLNGISYSINNFNADTTVYYVTLPSQTIAIPTLTFQTADFSATTSVSQPTSPNGVGLIMVTASDLSTYKTYMVFFQVEISSNANLDSLYYNGVAIANFHPDTLVYTVEIPYWATAPDSIEARPVANASTIYYSYANAVEDSTVITVLAEDLTTQKRYVVHFTQELSPVATLSSLGYQLANADSIISLSNNVFLYHVSIAEETMDIATINYTLSDSRATAVVINPGQRNDTATVVVVAQNGIDSNIYTIIFDYQLSSKPILTSITVNGVAIENFHPDTLSYHVILPFSTSVIPVVGATAQWQETQVQISQSGTVFGLAQVVVVAENQMAQKNYSIYFQQGSNVDLSSLEYTVANNTISISNFNSADTVYHVLLPIATTEIPTLSYALVDNRSSVITTLGQQANDTATVKITGWDGLAEKTYSVVFEVELSTEAKLVNLMIDSVMVSDFNPDTLSYSVEYAYGYNTLPIVSALASQPDARIEIEQISTFPQQAVIKVFAGDTSIYTIYTIDFSIESGNNNLLTSLSSNGVAVENFNKMENHTDVILTYGTTVVPTITAVCEDQRAQLTIVQAATLSDTAKIIVTAINGAINIYTVSFTIAANTDATLSAIKIDGLDLETFVSTTRNYSYPVSDDYVGVPVVTAVTTDSNARLEITAATEVPGQTRIEVTAANGTDKMTYRINFSLSELNIKTVDVTKVNVYPNPFNQQINVEVPDNLTNSTLVIYNAEGKIVAKQNISNTLNVVSVSTFSKGIYHLMIYQNNKTVYTGRFVKQ